MTAPSPQPTQPSNLQPAKLDPVLASLLEADKHALENAEIPVVTVSASYTEDLKNWYGLPDNDTLPDVVFSRAHYSMALGVATQAWGESIDPKKAWIVDPTNFVSKDDWKSIQLTEFVGKTLARQPLLKSLKDFVDRFGRNKLPILKSITPSLSYLTADIHKPILSMHVASGNILAEQGKKVVQVITDPHVRPDYLQNAHRANMTLCVFDDKTQTDVLELSSILGLEVDPKRVVVTGPPIDPRVTKLRERKQVWHSGGLKLCLTTGGLGTNKAELKELLVQLLPELRKRPSQLQVLVYAGTQKDINTLVTELARDFHVGVDDLDDRSAPLRVLYHPQIVNANELLLKYGFPWADGFITKPSGDMAYDAVASGSFILTLKEWGEWEYNVRDVFEQRGVGRKAYPKKIMAQLEALMKKDANGTAWITGAMERAKRLPPIFSSGSRNILKVVKDLG